jgi:hypothetical protein
MPRMMVEAIQGMRRNGADIAKAVGARNPVLRPGTF